MALVLRSIRRFRPWTYRRSYIEAAASCQSRDRFDVILSLRGIRCLADSNFDLGCGMRRTQALKPTSVKVAPKDSTVYTDRQFFHGSETRKHIVPICDYRGERIMKQFLCALSLTGCLLLSASEATHGQAAASTPSLTCWRTRSFRSTRAPVARTCWPKRRHPPRPERGTGTKRSRKPSSVIRKCASTF